MFWTIPNHLYTAPGKHTPPAELKSHSLIENVMSHLGQGNGH